MCLHMAETIDLPLAGNVKKSYVYMAGGVTAAIVGVAWYRHRQQAKAATVASTSSSTTSASPDPNAIDPATGLTYAEEATQQGGYMYGSIGSGGSGYSGPVDQFGNPLPAPIFPSSNSSLHTNEDWITTAESLPLGGASSDAIAAALTKVLGGLPVTQDQADIFHEVSGILGPPPQGYPSLRLVTSSGGGTGGGGGDGSGGSGGGSGIHSPGNFDEATLIHLWGRGRPTAQERAQRQAWQSYFNALKGASNRDAHENHVLSFAHNTLHAI